MIATCLSALQFAHHKKSLASAAPMFAPSVVATYSPRLLHPGEMCFTMVRALGDRDGRAPWGGMWALVRATGMPSTACKAMYPHGPIALTRGA
jgi:hypothetical protein